MQGQDVRDEIINTVALAKIMHEASPSYHVYEYEDMLKVLTHTLTELIIQGKAVRITYFGMFTPHLTPTRNVYNIRTKVSEMKYGRISVKFRPSSTLVNQLKQPDKE